MKIISAQEHQTVESPAVLTLTNDVDPRTLDLSGVTRIDLQFPAFTDGRAYSQAFLLRRRLGFAGELRAPKGNGQQEAFIETLRRVGHEPFKAAASAARHPAQDAETV